MLTEKQRSRLAYCRENGVPYHGRHRHVVVPSDEHNPEDPEGFLIRVWDIYRHGECVDTWFTSRKEAREKAKEYDAAERERNGL